MGSEVDAPLVDRDGNPLPRVDGTPVIPPDASNLYGDADFFRFDGGCSTTECPSPIPPGCQGLEACGDGLDNNCNGAADEGCTCTPGAVQPCFLGPPGRRGVGSCEDGTQRCQGSGEFPTWGPCEGGIWPSVEQCDTQDNNCDGCTDNNPECCTVDLACPGPGDMPEAAPFTDYVIDGSAFWSGSASSWSWTVVGGPCDQLLDSTSGKTSYTLSGADTSTLTFRPTLSGDYTVTMTVQTPDGPRSCTFIVHVRGPGMRVELCWDTTGDADIDLHLHRAGTTTPWFSTTLTGTTVNNDTCYYRNCKATHYTSGSTSGADWGYGASPLAECSGGPAGTTWTTIGSCHNPRLDIDNTYLVGIPENINVDNPNDAERFRVMVHHYGGSVTTHPLVNVYCGGQLLGTYGAAPDLVPGFTSGGGWGEGPMWRVVDVTTQVSGGVTTGCTLAPLHPSGSTTGYWVTNDDRSY